MARGRLRLLLRLRLVMDTDVDFLMVATDALTEDMVATDVDTMARGRLRLPTDTDVVAPTEDTVATGPMAAMVALTGMATESRQQLEHRHHMNKPKMLNMNWTKYKFSLSLKKKK